MVLVLLSVSVFAIFFILSTLSTGFSASINRIFISRWNWLYISLFLLPIGIGLYTWNTLRSEEITVTDAFISKQSRWGNQQFMWAQVESFHRISLLPKRRWINRVLSLRRTISRERLVWHLPPQAYELVGYQDENSEPSVIRLEPGTIDELPWLLELIQEHVGPPKDE
ncbi:MAG: hypothetical protein LLG44_09405 [Chloroflexi bacterium]|nr:hypothetical protein [Chloroflexota bacterium]